jgi:excisionase family DNA binding protein
MHYLTTAEVAQRYSISKMTLWRWLRDEKIGFPKPMVVNRRKLFDEAGLRAWELKRTEVSA